MVRDPRGLGEAEVLGPRSSGRRSLRPMPLAQQSWRDAKRAELVLAAKAYLGVVELESAVRDLLESYTAMDRSERPVPSELAACVRSLRASSGTLPQALGDLLPSLRRLTALASWEALHFREPS